MTPAELEAKVARSLRGLVTKYDEKEAAEIVLAVVREAMREPSDNVLTAIESVQVCDELPIEAESRAMYAAFFAASPLAEAGK